jgi:hypothetical protein
VSCLNGELVQINISHEDQRQSLEEQEASYLKLQREAEETCQSLEVEKKQVEVQPGSVAAATACPSTWRQNLPRFGT